ncbi:MAG: polyprenyl synthetase family protein, partial [Actinomycetia bacterium]|nr:polyprenyl synthetase family protein [Actinomycetes bacterium]
HINKTARLISASVVSSAILCGAEEGTIDGLRKYSLNIGLAFQITDDIIDIVSSSAISGKTQGKDKVQSKNTYPFLWGLDKSKKIAQEKINAALDAIQGLNIDSHLLEDIANFILLRKA